MARPKDNTKNYALTIVPNDPALSIQGNIELQILECPDEVICVQYNETFDMLLVSFTDGSIRTIKGNAFSMTCTDKDIVSGVFCTHLRHRPVSKSYPITNSIISTYSNGAIKSWNYNFAQCIFTLTEDRQSTCVSYHPKEAKFITGGDDNKLCLYDEESRRQERVFSVSATKSVGKVEKISCVVFHPKTPIEIISGSLDNTIQFWDSRQPNATRHIENATVTGIGLDFESSGKQFMAFCKQKERTCCLYDYATGNVIKEYQPDKFKNAPLNCGQYLNKDYIVVGGDTIMKIIEISTEKTIAQISKLPKPVVSITVGGTDASQKIPKFTFCSGKRIYQILKVS